MTILVSVVSCDFAAARRPPSERAKVEERELQRLTSELTGASVGDVLAKLGQPTDVTAQNVSGTDRELITFWYQRHADDGREEIILRVVFDGRTRVSGASANLTLR
ncbi:MAG TPA: hypothetical protein VGF48_17220 [Thermoanaerobaculia bacterium]